MATRPQTIEVRPGQGGLLMPDFSPESIGLANYTRKLDMRRVEDREARGEGYDLFFPIQEQEADAQSVPAAGETLRLIAELTRPNGQRAVIVGNTTTLWKFQALDDVAYGEAGYVTSGYWQTVPGTWLQIGSGFSANGNRWQKVSINGYLVLNNGVDLPMTYRLEDDAVKPIYELREMGVTSVGWITEHAGMLVCCNVRVLSETQLDDRLLPLEFEGMTAAQAGGDYSGNALVYADNFEDVYFGLFAVKWNEEIGAYEPWDQWTGDAPGVLRMINGVDLLVDAKISASELRCALNNPAVDTFAALPVAAEPWPFFTMYGDTEVIASGAAFTDAALVGQHILWASDTRRIMSQVEALHPPEEPPSYDPTVVKVDGFMPVVAAAFRVTNPAAYLPVTEGTQRYSWRVLWSKPDEPRRYGVVYTGSMAAGSVKLTLRRKAESLEAGMELMVTGAGYGGGNLTGTVLYVEAGGHFVYLDVPAQTAVEDVPVRAADVDYVLTGWKDLQDDSSAIVAAASLRETLVVYKETGIYLGQFTGDPADPFPFVRVIKTTEVPWYPHTLVDLAGQAHLYRGRQHFYTFDLVNRRPRVFEPLDPLRNWWLKGLSADQRGFPMQWPATDDRDAPWAVFNPVLNEIWLCGGTESVRYALNDNTVSTTAVVPTAAAGCVRPGLETQEWFLLAIGDTLFRYGLVNAREEAVTATLTKTALADTVTASAPTFDNRHYGWSLATVDGRYFGIVKVISSTVVQVVGSGTISSAGGRLVPAIWHRNGAVYSSVLRSGYGYSKDRELLWDRYVLALGAESPDTVTSVELKGGAVAKRVSTRLTVAVLMPNDENAINLLLREHFIGEQLTVAGMNNPWELTGRTYGVRGLDTRSLARRQTT